MTPWILFISGHRNDALILMRMLRGLHVLLDHSSGVEQARKKLRNKQFNVILTEAVLPDGNWYDVLDAAGESGTKVIVTDPQADARLWAEALNLGAFDLLAQPFHESEVRRILQNVCAPPVLRAAG